MPELTQRIGQRRKGDPPTPLTPQQQVIYDFIVEKQGTFGFPPTVAEIQKHMGYASPYTATTKLISIQRRGWIKLYPGAARGIRILEKYPLGEGER